MAFFGNLLDSEWSRSLVSNFEIESKHDATMKCDFDVTTLVFQSLKSSESEYDIRKTFGVDWSRSQK